MVLILFFKAVWLMLCTYLATSTKMNVDQSLKGQNRSKCVILYPAKDMDDIEINYLLSTKVQKKFVKYATATVYSMAVRAVEFSDGGIKLERFLPKNEHTQRKLLNFENWISGGLRSFQNQSF